MGKIQVLVASNYQLVRSAFRQLLRTQDTFDVLSVDVDAGQTLLESYPAISPDVLLLTAVDDIAFVRSMFSTGVLGYLLKSAAKTELFRAVHEVYRRRRFLDPRISRSASHHLHGYSAVQAGKSPNKLSRREMEVLRAIALGHTAKEIARDLDVSVKTVQTYRERIYTKLELDTRSDLVQYALAQGLGWDTDS